MLLRHTNLKLAWNQLGEHDKDLDFFCRVPQVVPEWLWRAHLPEVSSVERKVSVTQPLSAASWHRWLCCEWEGLEFASQKTSFAAFCLLLFHTGDISIHDGKLSTVG